MRFLPVLIFLLLASCPFTVRAQGSPVVLELYTSQGCSSCPPADALLAELSARPGVIALALHVDYWDYLGWEDSFGRAENTERQRAYARAAHKRSVFTPQMIIQGQDSLVGHRAKKIFNRIKAHRARPSPVGLAVSREGEALRIKLIPREPGVGAVDVQVVRFIPSHGVTIEAGENAGQRFKYTNIVTDWSTVARWDGRSEEDVMIPNVGGDPVAIIVQREQLGAILTAARLP